MKQSLIENSQRSTYQTGGTTSEYSLNIKQNNSNRRRGCFVIIALVVLAAVIIPVVLLVGKKSSSDDNSDTFVDAPMTDVLRAQILTMMNTTVDPCDNFYEYACGRWVAMHNPDPDSGLTMFSFDTIQDLVTIEYNRILQENFPFTTTVLNSCNNLAAIDSWDWKSSLGPWMNQISNIKDKPSLFAALGKMQISGLAQYALLTWVIHADIFTAKTNTFSTGFTGFSLPSYDPSSVGNFSQILMPLFTLYQNNGYVTDAASAVQDVIAVETWFWNNSPPLPQDPQSMINLVNLTSVSVFEAQTQIPLSSFLQALYPSHSFANVQYYLPATWSAWSQELLKTGSTSLSLKQIQNYLRWRVVFGVLDYLPQPFRSVADNMYATFGVRTPQDVFSSSLPLKYADPTPGASRRTWPYDDLRRHSPMRLRSLRTAATSNRDGFCQTYLQNNFANFYEHEWVIEDFPPANKAFATKLVNIIYLNMGERIKNVSWLDETTRLAALDKWSHIVANVGYDATWTDYVDLSVGNIMFDNALTVSQFSNNMMLALADNPVQRNRFSPGMLITVQNAFYDPTTNTINMLAGLMFPPFFSSSMPMLLNLASYGMVIGHEITHGFDNNGRNFDSYGAWRDWWTDSSAVQFQQRAECLAEQYSQYPVFTQFVNGNQTLGENIADNGGIGVAYQSYRQFVAEQNTPQLMSQFTNDQLFFLYFAQSWCSVITEQAALTRLQLDVHSPAMYRVLGPLSNFPPFAQAYNCSASSFMGRSLTSKRCSVW